MHHTAYYMCKQTNKALEGNTRAEAEFLSSRESLAAAEAKVHNIDDAYYLLYTHPDQYFRPNFMPGGGGGFFYNRLSIIRCEEAECLSSRVIFPILSEFARHIPHSIHIDICMHV